VSGDVNVHAFSLLNGGALQDLGTLHLDPSTPTGNSSAAAVSPTAVTAGTSDFDAVDPTTGTVNRFEHAFYFSNGKMKDVGTLGGSNSFGNGGWNTYVVGSSFITGDIATHAFFWKASTHSMTDLGTLPGGLNSEALGVNGETVVAGSSDSSDGTTHAVLWLNNKIHDLGTLGGSVAKSTAISEIGIPAGFGSTAGDVETHAWVGNLHDIGTLGGSYAQANAINKNGVVVGFSNTDGDADVHAFVWTLNQGMVDLNSLLPPGSPWDLNSANGIADDGTIVGVGFLNGQSHAFRLPPR
jgi:probable HAF family extracellular repeat protein